MASLPKNKFKAAIKQFQVQRGLWCSMRDQMAAEMMAGLGFDWMMFDTEHSPMDPVSLVPLLQAVAPYPVSPIVRPTCLNVAEIKKLLDIGAQTILVPYVQSAEEAALAVSAVTYPPEGIRGVAGLTRATRFGSIPGYHKAARDEICLLVQVETRSALEQLEDIAAVPGLDGIFIGPADLAASMGYPGEPNHPEVTQAVLDGIKRIRAAGLPPGILTLSADVRDQAIEAGAVFVANDFDLAALRKGLTT
ncbi:HpcH/HpaI aldolase family protein [Pacificoceanicola onchidii]|uniref:HpcH/HpaI aldolase family protein n=1 Tax=Pacificoceanicola onchidii TaxID=2562685 RepID=UPI0010A65652|nr:aldolase/citrate lyase family protein [Pacificoceanicola onchidii]